MAVGGSASPCLLITWYDRDEKAIDVAHAQGMLVTALKVRHQEDRRDDGRYIREVTHRLDRYGKVWIEAQDARVLRKAGYTVRPKLLLDL